MHEAGVENLDQATRIKGRLPGLPADVPFAPPGNLLPRAVLLPGVSRA